MPNGWRAALTWVLSLLGWLAVATPGIAQTNSQGLSVVPLTIVNNHDPSATMYVYIRGIVEDTIPSIPAGSWVYVSNVNGDVTVVPAISTSYQSLAFSLGSGTKATLNVPKLSSMRVYVSFAAPVLVCCSGAAGSSPSDPAGWDQGNPNYSVLFDWAELNWDNTGNAQLGHTTRLGGNVTQVDMFGLPLLLTMNGQSPSQAAAAVAKAGFAYDRATLMSAYQQLGTPWTGLIMYDNSVAMRVIAPYHAIPLGTFPSNELDSYIAQVSSFYGTTPNAIGVTASCSQDNGVTHTFSGTVSAGVMTFTEGGSTAFQFPVPGTLTVYENGIQASPTPSTPLYTCLAGVVAAKLGGSYVRTNLITNSNLDACTTSQFYVSTPIQQYAKFFHDYGFNNLAYSFGYDDTCNQSSYVTIDDPTSASIIIGGPRTAHDFNRDGNADIAWRDGSGNTALWLMNGGAVASSGGFGAVATTWSIVGQRDFDGDGKTDWLWRDSSGNTAIWFLNGTAVASTGFVGNVGTAWSIVSTADLNGDGKGDLIWRDTSGNTSVWLMNGAAVASSGGLGTIPTSWSVAATADFDGDGKADILWRDTSGNTALWFMNGAAVASTGFVGTIPTTWTIIGTGDFDGNGKADILWRDSSGNVALWLMNGAAVSSTGGLGNVPSVWSLPLTGDFNADGKSDLVWNHSSGATSLWFMNGAAVSSSAFLGTVTGWTVQGTNAE